MIITFIITNFTVVVVCLFGFSPANKQRKILIKKASSLKKIEVEVDKGSLKKHSNNTATSQICLIL